MTPEQRRAKYPLPEVTPLTRTEIAALKEHAREWLVAPPFTERVLDRHHYVVARLITTLERGIQDG